MSKNDALWKLRQKVMEEAHRDLPVADLFNALDRIIRNPVITCEVVTFCLVYSHRIHDLKHNHFSSHVPNTEI